MDKIMRKFGLRKSVVPFPVQPALFPAIMATRNIENWKNA
jgi:Fe2+ transport system protein B